MKLSQETRDAIQIRYARFLADRAKYVRKDSGPVAIPTAQEVDAGNPPPAKPALSAQHEAIVAWDLTLRCPVCNSAVEGRVHKYRCFACERRGR